MEQYDEQQINDLAMKTAKLAMEVKQLEQKLATPPQTTEEPEKLKIALTPEQIQLKRANTLLVINLQNIYSRDLKPRRNDDAYNEALQNTLLYICQNIHRYDGEKPLIHWIRVKLKHAKIDQQIQGKRKTEAKTSQVKKVVSADAPLKSNSDNQNTVLDFLPSSENSLIKFLLKEPQDLEEAVRQALLEDSEGIFEQKVFKKNTKANYRFVALERLDKIPWQEILDKIGWKDTNVGPISTWYQRCNQDQKILNSLKKHIYLQ